jgi:hypothetical protein
MPSSSRAPREEAAITKLTTIVLVVSLLAVASSVGAPPAAATGARTAPAAAAATMLELRPPAQPRVEWRGLVGPIEGDPDSAASMPGLGVIGIVVSATRGAIGDAEQKEALRLRQEQADRALEPVRAALDRHDAAALWKETAARLAEVRVVAGAGDGAAARDRWTAEVTPRFRVAANLEALVLDADIALRAPGATGEPTKTAVRVVSPPGRGGDAWKADDARALKAEAATMLAHAIEQAVWAAQHAPAPATTSAAAAAAGTVPPAAAPSTASSVAAATSAATASTASTSRQRTHRYPLAGTLRAERGWLLREGCARLVIRTLRQALWSVPRPVAAPASSCEAPYAV